MNDIKKSGYETAIKLTDKTARTIWSLQTSLLASNAFLLSLAAFLAPTLSKGNNLVLLISLLSVIICIARFLITMRNFDFYKYYFAWARKFEKEAFGNYVEMVRKGEDFAKGNEVTVLNDIIRLRWGSRLFRVEWLVSIVILSFIAVYLIVNQ